MTTIKLKTKELKAMLPDLLELVDKHEAAFRAELTELQLGLVECVAQYSDCNLGAVRLIHRAVYDLKAKKKAKK